MEIKGEFKLSLNNYCKTYNRKSLKILLILRAKRQKIVWKSGALDFASGHQETRDPLQSRCSPSVVLES